MKKLFITILMFLPLMASAQSVTTAQQQLEQAQKQLEEAKKALQAAKIQAEAARIKAQADSIQAAAKATQEEAKAIQEKAKATEQQVKAAEQRAKAAEQKANAATQVEPVVVKEPSTPTSGWVVPTAVAQKEAKKVEKTTDGLEAKVDPKYLAGAITTNAEGKVEFVLDTDANGKSATQIYDIVYQYMVQLTQGENNIGSRVALVNKGEHIIANTMDEWFVFNQSFISLDRTEAKYNLVAKISDNHLNLTLSRIVFSYEEGRSTGFKLPAEKVIVDKMALTKKKNDLAKLFGKFRRLTIDRKDQIFNDLNTLIKQ